MPGHAVFQEMGFQIRSQRKHQYCSQPLHCHLMHNAKHSRPTSTTRADGCSLRWLHSKPRNRREVVSRRDATRLARLSCAYDIHLLSLKHLLDPSVGPIVHNVANRRILLNSWTLTWLLWHFASTDRNLEHHRAIYPSPVSTFPDRSIAMAVEAPKMQDVENISRKYRPVMLKVLMLPRDLLSAPRITH